MARSHFVLNEQSLIGERAKLGFRDIYIVGTTNVGKRCCVTCSSPL